MSAPAAPLSACGPSNSTSSSEILLNPTNAQIALAFGLTLAAAGSTCLGAAAVWVANLANPLLLAAALGASAGVMVYVSLVEIVQKSVGAFEAAGSSHAESYRWATLSFFGGVALIWMLDRFVLTRFVAWASRRAREKTRRQAQEQERAGEEASQQQPPQQHQQEQQSPVGAAAASVAAAAARDLAQLPSSADERCGGGGGVCRGGRADDDEDGDEDDDGSDGEAKGDEGDDDPTTAALGKALARIRHHQGCCHPHDHGDEQKAAATETVGGGRGERSAAPPTTSAADPSTAVAATALAARPHRRLVALLPFRQQQRQRRQSAAAAADVENAPNNASDAAPSSGPSPEDLGRIGLTAGLALSIHNAPEGLATFVGALASPSTGFAVAIAIILHNVPEGMVVALPVAYATRSRWRGFLWGCVPAIAEPIGALIGWGIVRSSRGAAGSGGQALVYGLMFGGVAGIMTFLSVHELLPAALRNDPRDRVATMSFILGAAVIAASLLLFQA
jgi:ZIP family zinc transporter